MNEHVTIENITDYIHHALAPEEDAAVHAHINSCTQCRALYQEEAALSEALRTYARATERELPAGVSAAIWDAIAHPQPTLADAIRSWFRPLVLAPLAAAILVVALLLPQVFSRLALPGSNLRLATQSIDASYYLQDHAEMNRTVPFADAAAVVSSPLTTSVALAANEAQ